MMDNQEPMMLGSPVGHVSPTVLHQHSANQFLPGFLMGDPNVLTTAHLNRSVSGGGPSHAYMHSLSFGGFTAKSSPPSATLSPGTKFSQVVRSRVITPSSVGAKEKAGAPPVSSLTDDNGQNRSGVADIVGRSSQRQHQDSNTPRMQQHVLSNPRRIMMGNEHELSGSIVKTPPSPAQVDPFYAQGESITSNIEMDDTWVTVYGFPCTASSYILQQFSRCGVILEHYPAPDEGNWMHIHFESKLQARRALSKSGKILPVNLMIGVTPCIDLKVMGRQEPEATHETMRVPSARTPGTPGGTNDGFLTLSNTHQSNVNSTKLCTIRPLTAAYNAASSGNKVDSDVRTPQKTSGLITKAMDYIFG